MKKYFLSIVALAGMLFATSCQESLVEPQVGGTTTFTVQVPDQMGTKADPTLGLAANVNQLFVAVYADASAANATPIYRDVVAVSAGKATVSLNLIQGQLYDVIFWAQVDNNYVSAVQTDNEYTFDLVNIPMNKNYHNTDAGAAFFYYWDNFQPTGTSQPVTLRRPFAQLNLGTTEGSLTNNAGTFTLKSSVIKVKGIADNFNTVSGFGTVTEANKDIEYTFDAVALPSDEKINVAGVDYKYVSMDYLPIVGDDEALITVKATITLSNDQVINHQFTNVPVKENYRTNIVGNLISSTTDFNVVVDDSFVNDDNNIRVVTNYEELKAAVIKGGKIEIINDITVDKWIMFSEDYSLANQIITLEKIDVTINGNGHTLTINSIESGGNGIQLFQGATNLNISNLTIKYADGLNSGGIGLKSGVISKVNFVGGNYGITPGSGEITVEECTFATNRDALYSEEETNNLTVTRCTFNQPDLVNVILLRGDVKFTNNIINSGRTVNIVSGSPVVDGNNFNNVRFKVYVAATAYISNNTINVLEFDKSNTTFSSYFADDNILSDAAKALLKTMIAETPYVSTYDELVAAVKKGGEIKLANDITVDKWTMFSEDYKTGDGTIIKIDEINVTINGNGHTLTINDIESGNNGSQLFQGATNLNISNLTIKYADGLNSGGIGLNSGVIENVHFVGGGSAIYPGEGNIKIDRCTFATKSHAIYYEAPRDNLTVTGCTFTLPTGANVILLRGKENFTNNIINSGRTVNIVSGSPVVDGNNFNDVRLKVYGDATATVSKNIINNLEFETNYYKSTFVDNTLSASAQAALNNVTKVN
ncbi:MAG: hypothetical protein J6U51_08965 [Bacteroidales bacterium]|nr:hypothetical protein [Bacteroidales bacterium]